MKCAKVDYNVNVKSDIKCSFKKDSFSAKEHRDLHPKKRKYHDDPKQKRHLIKNKY